MDSPRFYQWQQYRCAYGVHHPEGSGSPVLVLIHPVGVGLSRHFWQRFIPQWSQGGSETIYAPDLLGCGDSDMPRRAYYPQDWAAQLEHFITTVVQRPVVLGVQGALLPVALWLLQRPGASAVQGMVLSGPPGWPLISQAAQPWQQRLLWNGLFNTPWGAAFYRYARREQFLASFSERQLFADSKDIDRQWLEMLQQGAADMDSRFAVFSFLAGFWRQDYTEMIEAAKVPTLVLFGEAASGIDRVSREQTPEQRLQSYLTYLPQGSGELIVGRNVMPYEAAETFAAATRRWWQQTMG